MFLVLMEITVEGLYMLGFRKFQFFPIMLIID